MKLLTALVCVLGTAGSLRADPYSESIQQARRASAATTRASNAQVDSAPAATPAMPPAQAAPPPNPMLMATLQNITTLCTVVAALNHTTDAQPSADQKTALLNDLSAAAQGTKPSKDSVEKLSGHLVTVTLGKTKLTAVQQLKLARYLHASFNGAHLTAAQQTTIFNDVKKILEDGGASADDISNVVDDLKAIAADTK
jgi:hypothetical protein